MIDKKNSPFKTPFFILIQVQRTFMSGITIAIFTFPALLVAILLLIFKRKNYFFRHNQSCSELSPYVTSTISILINKKISRLVSDDLTKFPRLIVDKITSNILAESHVDIENPKPREVNHAILSRIFLTGIKNDEFRIFVPTEIPYFESIQKSFESWIEGIKNEMVDGLLYYPNNLMVLYKNYPLISNSSLLTNLRIKSTNNVIYKINTLLLMDPKSAEWHYKCGITGVDVGNGDPKYLSFTILNRV